MKMGKTVSVALVTSSFLLLCLSPSAAADEEECWEKPIETPEDVVREVQRRHGSGRDQIAIGDCGFILIQRSSTVASRREILARVARVAAVVEQSTASQPGQSPRRA